MPPHRSAILNNWDKLLNYNKKSDESFIKYVQPLMLDIIVVWIVIILIQGAAIEIYLKLV